jgi:hypothetical protein
MDAQESTNEPSVEPPIRPEAGLSNCMGNQEPPGLPQEAHVTVPPPLEKRVIRIGINTYPLNPLSCGIIAPYNSSPCPSSSQRCVYY